MKKIVLVLIVLLVSLHSYSQSPYKVAIEMKYDSVKSLDGAYFAVKDNGFWGVVKDNTVILPCKYDAIEDLGDDVITFAQNGKAGFADVKGNVIIPAKYTLDANNTSIDNNQLNVFSNGPCLVFNDGKLEIINKQDKRVVGDTVEILSKVNDVVVYKKDAAYGIMNAQGEEKTEAKYMQIQPLILGQLYAYIAQRDGQPRYGIISGTGKLISFAYFDDLQIYRTTDNTYIKAFLPSGKQALYSKEGNILFQPIYQSIEPTQYPSFFNIIEDTRKGIIGKDYVVYVLPRYDDVKVKVCKDTFFVAKNGDMSYIINMKNEVVSQIKGEVIDIVSNENNEINYIADSLLNYGVRSSKDVWKVRPQYDDVFCTVGESFVMKKDKKWGAIDINNNIVVPFEYENVKTYTNNPYVVFFGNKKQSILLKKDKTIKSFPSTKSVLTVNDYIEYTNKKQLIRLFLDGREISAEFVSIGAERDGILNVNTKQGWTYVDSKTLKPLTKEYFDFATAFNDGFALVIRNNSLMVIDTNFSIIQTLYNGEGFNLRNIAVGLNFSKQVKRKYFITQSNNKQGVILIQN